MTYSQHVSNTNIATYIMFYDNRETPLAGNFVGQCQGHKSDVSTQSWVLISEKMKKRNLFTDEDPGLGRNV